MELIDRKNGGVRRQDLFQVGRRGAMGERRESWADSRDSECDIMFKMSEVDFPRMLPNKIISVTLV